MAHKIHIPARCWFYGTLAAGLSLFTLIFPYYSVQPVMWAQKNNLYYPIIMCMTMGVLIVLSYAAKKYWPLIKKSRKLTLVTMTAVVLYLANYDSVADVGEKLHVLDFSVLAILIYKTFSPLMKLEKALFWAWFLTSMLAAIDESNQILIPGRGGTLHDVFIGVRSATVGVILAWVFDSYSRRGRGTAIPKDQN